MQPNGGKLPWGGLLQQIEKDFGSFSNFRDDFVQTAITFFGSGWVWLICELIVYIYLLFKSPHFCTYLYVVSFYVQTI